MPGFKKIGIVAAKQYFIYRLLMPFIAGIIIGFNYSIASFTYYTIITIAAVLVCIYNFLPTAIQFTIKFINSIALYALVFGCGLLVVHKKNITHQPTVATNYYKANTPVWLELTEDISTKTNSYKAEASILYVMVNGSWVNTTGKTILYFKKDSTTKQPPLSYKQQIITQQQLQPIVNAGNPGGFNYKQYTAFNGIIYQTFIPNKNYITIGKPNIYGAEKIIYTLQKNILAILRKYIPSAKELAIAEALLIGYREDLDRDTVQAYSNTGVVHIIAISGMHLAMIYGLLIFIFSFFKPAVWLQYTQLIVVIITLWLFTCIAGAAPSILRSAIMFTCIIVGQTFSRQHNIYHTIGLSAFIILTLQPFSLWNVGFQLSYAAVISIVVFNSWIKNWIYSNNKVLQYLWNLCAITLAAQIFTLPLVLYHFHQFPLLFLLTNLVAVPLSGFVLYACIFLLLIAWLPLLAKLVGGIIAWLLWLLNGLVIWVNEIPFAVWPSIQLSIVQATILCIILIALAIWVLHKNYKAAVIAMYAIVAFVLARSIDMVKRNQQHQLIVYNVPKHTAIDIVEGRNYFFIGDSVLLQDGFLRNFHIKPARILYRTTPTKKLNHTAFNYNIIQSPNKKIIVLDKPLQRNKKTTTKIEADIIVITKNPTLYIQQIDEYFSCKQIVVDANNAAWKVKYWKKDAQTLGLPIHYVVEQGAFVTNL